MARRRKGKKNKRPRAIALELSLQGQANLAPLIQQARRQAHNANRAVQRRKQAQLASEKAQQQAEHVTELFLRSVPLICTAADIAQSVLSNLVAGGVIPAEERVLLEDSRAKSANCAVLRCEVRRPRKGIYGSAYVAMRNEQFAAHLLTQGRLEVVPKAGDNVFPVEVQSSFRVTVPGVGSAWRTSLDPGSGRWKIGTVQVGEKVGEGEFRHFWSSTPFFDLTENSFIEVNPVQTVLAITLGRKQNLLKATVYKSYSGGTEGFELVESMLRIEIPFRIICDKVKAERNRGGKAREKYAVYFPIAKGPHLFRAVGGQRENGFGDEGSKLTWDCQGGCAEEMRWVRTVDFTKNAAFERARGIRIIMEYKQLAGFFEKMYYQYQAESQKPGGFHLVRAVAEENGLDKVKLLEQVKRKYGFSFKVRYMIDCVLSLGTISLGALTPEFWHLLKGMEEDEAMLALELMFSYVSANEYYTRINDPVKILEDCMHTFQSHSQVQSPTAFPADESDSDETVLTDDTEEFQVERFKQQLPLDDAPEEDEVEPPPKREVSTGHYTYIRRLIYTPTRTLAMKPEADLLNRILRKYGTYEEKFLRVSFCDEGGGQIGFASSEDLYTRVRAVLRNGIYAAGEKFVFLAFSNSQLRDHAAWFYNETPDDKLEPLTADDVRAWMGNFHSIRVPGKYAARQGQAFSSTVGTYTLEALNELQLSDIHDAEKRYTFSDGVGVISQALADHVTRKLRVKWNKPTPSAFQIRYGGAKGMLTVWNDILPPGDDIHVALRPSMVKFDSEHRTLEVVGFSKRLPLFLNRQIIVLLSTMGVPNAPFVAKQKILLRKLDRAMRNDGAEDALDLLLSTGLFQSDFKLKTTAPAMNATAFFQAGLTCTSCEHLFNMMYAFRRRILQDLSGKARIPIDSNKGFCAIGVMDELGVLNENEVFCQYTNPATGDTKILNRSVIVGRSPCLHPGDIQPVWAVDCPALRHLVDVIVFSQKGKRPLPSMLGGGDLDGDIFFCLFDSEIMPQHPQGAAPMDYTQLPPTTLDREITTSDVADFFVEYIRNDRLGQIANAHLVHADKERAEAKSEKCIRLAHLHSVAVDFAKTSTPADFPRELQLRNQAGEYPDFMGKHPKVSYDSRKVLGKLYRDCVSIQSGEEGYKFVPNSSSDRIDAIIDRFPTDEDTLEEAKGLCTAYNVDLRRLMNQYGVATEGEMLSGQVLSFSVRHAQMVDKKKHFDVTMRMNRQANELRLQFRAAFFKDLGQKPGGRYTVDTIVKACAWYKACQSCAEEDRMRNEPALVSFPWVVADVLLPAIRVELKSSWEWGFPTGKLLGWEQNGERAYVHKHAR